MKAKRPAASTQDPLRSFRTHPLDAVFAPASIAVIGATEKEGSVGRAVMENLAPFSGRVYAVNPRRKRILGRAAFPDIRSLPEAPDLAVIITPADVVPDGVRQCAAAGVGAAIIISAGFKETGAAGLAREEEILGIARRSGMRLIGPNCLGIMAPHRKLNATFAGGMAHPGSVAFISQSGALCTAILDWSLDENVGFSGFVSVGSMLDVDWGDLIYYFGGDPRTKSIVCYIESVGNARAFLSAAREVALSKPIIVIKVGRTEAAAKAAASHTGSLTGSDEVLDAAFRRVGVLRVDTIGELFHMAEILAKQPPPQGPRLAIITNAGGPGALSTDLLVTRGGRLAKLSPETHTALDELLPEHWSRGNPVDILGDADAERYGKAVEIVSRDPENDGLLVVLTPQKMTESTATAEQLQRVAKLGEKPVLASWMGGREVQAGKTILNKAGIPTFPYPDTAARAFALMWRYGENLRSLYETPALPSMEASAGRSGTSKPTHPAAVAARVAGIIAAARRKGRLILTEIESKRILATYGIPVVKTLVARDRREAAAIAAKIGFPVVLKLHSETVTHKSDVGGVQLNIRTQAGLRRAWNLIEEGCLQKAGPGHFLGCTVQPMVAHDGYELILGSSIDPQFGPVLLFGAGGQLVEVMRDRALGLPPLTVTLARRLMEQTRIYAALGGTRGRPPVDLSRLEELLVRFSQLVVEQRSIAEIDINPLLASSQQFLALDARIVIQPPGIAEDRLPPPAIRPYPLHYVTPSRLRDGTRVILRPIRPDDENLMLQFHQSLSERTVQQRYFGALSLSQRTAHERLIRICFSDYDREIALVAEHRSGRNRTPEILAIGRLSKLHGRNEGEFALLVSDPWQGRGLGRKLLQMLVQIGRDEKLERIIATILPENESMQDVAKSQGFTIHRSSSGDELLAELRLSAPPEKNPRPSRRKRKLPA